MLSIQQRTAQNFIGIYRDASIQLGRPMSDNKNFMITAAIALVLVGISVSQKSCSDTSEIGASDKINSDTSTASISNNPKPAYPVNEPNLTFEDKNDYFARADGVPFTELKVQFWNATNLQPCVARISTVGSNSLPRWLRRQQPDGRMGLGAKLLQLCTGRFVYLDGGAEPGLWQEYIGKDVPDVAHAVSFKFEENSSVVIEFRPGESPELVSEISRLQKMLSDVDNAMLSESAENPNVYNTLLAKKKIYTTELEKLIATK